MKKRERRKSEGRTLSACTHSNAGGGLVQLNIFKNASHILCRCFEVAFHTRT